MKSKNLAQVLITLAIGLAFLLSWSVSCDKFNNAIEDKIREDEFEMEDVDQTAATLLSDSAMVDTSIAKNAVGVDTTGTNYIFTFTGTRKDTIPQTSITRILDSLTTYKNVVTVKDTAYLYRTSATLNNNCLSFTNGQEEEVVFYFTDYVLMEIIDASGTLIAAESDQIPVELSAGCFTIKANVPTPIVKARYAYELAPNTRYLFKIVKNDQTLADDIRGLILNK